MFLSHDDYITAMSVLNENLAEGAMVTENVRQSSESSSPVVPTSSKSAPAAMPTTTIAATIEPSPRASRKISMLGKGFWQIVYYHLCWEELLANCTLLW